MLGKPVLVLQHEPIEFKNLARVGTNSEVTVINIKFD